MDESTITSGDNSELDANTNSTTDNLETQSTETDTQTADSNSDNLDPSKSADTSADGDKSTEDDSKSKNDTSNGASDDDTSASSNFDKDLDSWAERTGRPAPANDNERALLQEIRDKQREFSKAQTAKDANNDIKEVIDKNKPDSGDDEDDSGDPLENDVKDIKGQLAEERALRLRNEFLFENSVTTDQVKVMGDILKEKVDKGGKTAFDYWTHPDQLQDWLDLADAKLSKTSDDTELIDEAARKERERIAKEQQANSPGRNAKPPVTSDDSPEKQRLKTFSNWD
ncbi:hypothetical protein EKK58_09530 [Candidatus Dependentiae bacterium]|nr:MAG: hypothetical protein EKK58_09530 [Candidatus Dependentiae bacterium]